MVVQDGREDVRLHQGSALSPLWCAVLMGRLTGEAREAPVCRRHSSVVRVEIQYPMRWRNALERRDENQ